MNRLLQNNCSRCRLWQLAGTGLYEMGTSSMMLWSSMGINP